MSMPFAPIDLSRVAAVLDDLSHEIELLGVTLCADPAVLARHLDGLQVVDRIAQYQRAIANLLREGGMHTGFDGHGLEDLMQRLAPV